MPPRTRALAGESEAGFTLLEIVIALAILGLSLGVLFGILSHSISRAKANEVEARERALARAVLGQATIERDSYGATGHTDDGLIWHLQTVPYGTAEDAASWSHRLVELRLTISTSGGGHQFSYRTLRLMAQRVGP